jgi:hypothetical protein
MAGYKGPYKGVFKQGDSGLDCAAVKRCLKRRQNAKAIKASRKFGKAATDALRTFQKNQHLGVDGIFGPQTFKAMAPLMRGYEVYLYKRAKPRVSTVRTWVVMAPGADRPGQKTHDKVKAFVSKTAHQYGSPLVITTGTNHNQYVAGTTRESAHWKGNAADIAMYGRNLTRLGQAALRAAGMSRAKSLTCRGGVYNVGGWNILFNTTVGGNHWNHVHCGTR